MKQKQTILVITKTSPIPAENRPGQERPMTILTFPEPYLAKEHLDAYLLAEKKLLAERQGWKPEELPLIPAEQSVRRRIIDEQCGNQTFNILANRYDISWRTIPAEYDVSDDEKISDQAFLILLEDHKTTETIQLEELADAVRQYGIPNPADPKSVFLTIAPMDIHSMPVDPFDLMQNTLGYAGIEVTYRDKHGYLQDGYVTAIEVYDKAIQFHVTVDMLKRKNIILQRYELHSNTVDSLHDLVLEGLNSESRDWLVLYNSVLKHGAKKGLDIWSRYDGVYMAGIPDGWPHDIPADKDKQYAERILDNLRDGKSVSESIEFLIP